jgi:hypothetical protein
MSFHIAAMSFSLSEATGMSVTEKKKNGGEQHPKCSVSLNSSSKDYVTGTREDTQMRNVKS